jgi:porphobilinogen synthase
MRETTLQVDDLIMPLFVVHGTGIRQEIVPMPGNYQLSVDQLTKEVKEIAALGIPAVILFGIPEHKDAYGSEAYAKDGIIQQAVRAIKDSVTDLLVITDTCLCEYTSHGHCGVVEHGSVKNDPTLELLAKAAVSQAEAGADMIAPSDMMDGRVAAIREALDTDGFEEVAIMAYAAKYASSFYGPFREAAEATPQFGDRRSYQMDPANATEALREVAMDIEEGADIVMVKPALAYLDVVWRIRTEFDVARLGWLEEERVMCEILTAIKRAGADLILTYFAKDAARLLRRNE